MERRPAVVQKQSILGNHVMRHKPGIWNGISQLMKDVSLMAEDSQKDIITHKEEMSHRIRADNEDRAKFLARIKIAIELLDPHDHTACIINIVTGRIATDNVTVDQYVTIIQQHMI
ncbi:hypothetical protein LSH36_457g00001 [Paralvinella palmiformis]|uniref:Uncharacterized protein n=1 Tax=Paralvinella palmiformis TaxID=53620 RepID=A0AAD9MXP4_9ANNE|nr:hypothetical protein LSH36_457g00001 [Paralvinella palmiformis]